MPELWPPRIGGYIEMRKGYVPGPLYEWLRSRFPNASASAARRAAMDIDAYVRDLLRNQRAVHVRQARIGSTVDAGSRSYSVQLRTPSPSVALRRIRDATAAGRPYAYLKAWQEAPADALDLIHRARGSRVWRGDELNADRIPRPELIEPHIEEALKLAAQLRRPSAWRRDVTVGVIIDHFIRLGGEPGQKHRLAFVLGIEAFYSGHAPSFSVDFGLKRSGRNRSRLLG